MPSSYRPELGWLVKHGLLEVRVGVLRRGEGIVHAKFGIATDENGAAIVFSGSGNESANGLMANYERLDVSGSWTDPERHDEYANELELLWNDTHPDVHTVPLPEALRLKLVKFAPPEPPIAEPSNALARQRAAMIAWKFIEEAVYLPQGESACDHTAMVELWPHQRHVVGDEWDGTYPDPGEWRRVEQAAQEEAQAGVAVRELTAETRERAAVERQVAAARLRLLREMGRYLVCVADDTADLNRTLYEQINRDIASAGRLKACLGRLAGLPEWPAKLTRELSEFVQRLTPNQRKARLLGSEIDAAIEDPRWKAQQLPCR